MKVRALIEGSSYGPETMKVMTQAFDAAWECVAPNFEDDQSEVALARDRLAHAILAITTAEATDPETVKWNALRVLSLSYGKPLTTSQA